MPPEQFYSEWFRITHITRKRMIHTQMMGLTEDVVRLELTPMERASLQGMEMLQARLWKIRRGE